MNGSTPRITKRTHYALGDRKIPTVHVVDEGATGVEFTDNPVVGAPSYGIG